MAGARCPKTLETLDVDVRSGRTGGPLAPALAAVSDPPVLAEAGVGGGDLDRLLALTSEPPNAS